MMFLRQWSASKVNIAKELGPQTSHWTVTQFVAFRADSFERKAGFQLLQKIRIDNATVVSSKPPLRLFCGMYTYSHNRDKYKGSRVDMGPQM